MNITENDEIDLMELFYVIKSRILVLIITGILTAAAAFVVSNYVITPQYSSTSKLYMVNKTQSLTSLSLSDLQMGSQLTKDYMILVKSRPVAEQVIENLGLHMTYEQLEDIMKVSNPSDTRILEITIEYPDAYIAKQIVDEVADVSGKQMAKIMEMKEPSVMEEGYVSKKPTSPNTKRNTVLGGLIGVIVAAAIICVIYLLDDTVKTPEDVEKYFGLTTLGLIPLEEGKQAGNKKKKRKTKKNSVTGGAK